MNFSSRSRWRSHFWRVKAEVFCPFNELRTVEIGYVWLDVGSQPIPCDGRTTSAQARQGHSACSPRTDALHWREHHPQVVADLEREGTLQQAIEAAADRLCAMEPCLLLAGTGSSSSGSGRTRRADGD